jgi:hypothetical protein
MKRINWKTWTGTATFWKTLSKRSLLVFLAGVFCLLGSLGFILDSRNPQATTAGELTMNILVRACFAVGWAFFGTHRMFKSMIPLPGVQVSAIWLLHRAYSSAPKLASNSAALAGCGKSRFGSKLGVFLVTQNHHPRPISRAWGNCVRFVFRTFLPKRLFPQPARG